MAYAERQFPMTGAASACIGSPGQTHSTSARPLSVRVRVGGDGQGGSSDGTGPAVPAEAGETGEQSGVGEHREGRLTGQGGWGWISGYCDL